MFLPSVGCSSQLMRQTESARRFHDRWHRLCSTGCKYKSVLEVFHNNIDMFIFSGHPGGDETSHPQGCPPIGALDGHGESEEDQICCLIAGSVWNSASNAYRELSGQQEGRRRVLSGHLRCNPTCRGLDYRQDQMRTGGPRGKEETRPCLSPRNRYGGKYCYRKLRVCLAIN